MITTRYDYLRTLLHSCTATEPMVDIFLAKGRMAMRTDALLNIATRASESDAFLDKLVPEGAVVDAGAVGRGLLLLGHSVLDQHFYRAFADERLAFDPVLLTGLDEVGVPADVRRCLARRRVFAVGDFLTLPQDERLALLETDVFFSVVDKLSRCGIKDVACSGWPPRHRVVPLAISVEGLKALSVTPLASLPLKPRVACALELSWVERIGDLTAGQWAAVRNVYALPADLTEETEQVFAGFGVDLTDVSLLEPGEDILAEDCGLSSRTVAR